jgi:hypothetical protein
VSTRQKYIAVASLATLFAVASPAIAQAGTDTGVPPATAGIVTLPTGDQVRVLGSGAQSSAVLAGAAHGSGFEHVRDPQGDDYLIPAEVAPYLGRELDRSLFDVTALARQGLTGGARTPVSLTFSAGVKPAAPPGVTLTSVSGQSASGYLDAHHGGDFAAGLRKQIGADVAAGRRPGATAPFPGLTSLALTGAKSPQAANPQYVLHPLQINAVGLDGKAADADVYLTNTDSLAKMWAEVPAFGGVGRIQAPSGHYSLTAMFQSFDTSGKPAATRLVVLTDFTVPDKASTVTVDERTADLPVSASTPRPSTMAAGQVLVQRGDSTGQSSGVGVLTTDASAPIFVNATPATKVGTLTGSVAWTAAAADPADDYLYNMVFGPFARMPADEHFVGRDTQLATVRDSLYTDPAATGGLLTPEFSAVSAGFVGYPVTAHWGHAVTQYLGTALGGDWLQFGSAPGSIPINGDVRKYTAGKHYDEDWGKGPLAPVFNHTDGPASQGDACYACTAGSSLYLALTQAGDSVLDHQAAYFTDPATSRFTLYRDGAVVADHDNSVGAYLKDAPQTAATYRAVYDLVLSEENHLSQATRSHTELTVKSDPAHDPVVTGDRMCPGQTASTPCRLLPAMTVRYRLDGTDLNNVSSAAKQTLTLDVTHASYNGVTSGSPITSATVSLSFDGGKTWQNAPVTGGAGCYRATWSNTQGAKGSSPTIKVVATDARGDAISQTITNAYTIGAVK